MRIIFFDKRSGKPITQLGNVLSPTWERFIPTVGTSRSTNGNARLILLNRILFDLKKLIIEKKSVLN
jgi:hypothetical protein